MTRFPHLWLAAAAAAAALVPSLGAADYAVLARRPIGGKGTYDYIRFDGAHHRLYIGHDQRFEVLDASSGRKVGEITGVSRAHGVALDPELDRGFASSGNTNSIVMFDLASLKTLKVIKSTGTNPDSVEYDPASKRVYAVNGASGNVTVIDPNEGKVVATVKLVDGKLEQIGFDGRGRAFVNNEKASAMHVFDTGTLQALATWSLSPGEGGTGLAVDTQHHRAFAACGNHQLVVVDTDSGKVVATPAIGEDPDGAVYDARRGLVFTSNVEGTLSILHQDSPDSYSPVQTVTTAYGARTIAYDPSSGTIYLVTAQFGPAPAPTAETPEPKRPVLPGTFELLVVGAK